MEHIPSSFLSICRQIKLANLILFFFLVPILNHSNAINAQASPNISFGKISAKTYGDFTLSPLNISHSQGKTLSVVSSDTKKARVEKNESGWSIQALLPGTVTITASCGVKGASDYEEKNQTITISKAMLTVSAHPQSRGYRVKNPIVNKEYIYDGFIDLDDEKYFDNLPIAYIDPKYDIDYPVGIYINGTLIKGGSHPYYDLVYIYASFQITGYVDVGETFTKVYGEPDFDLINEIVEIDKISVESGNPDIITISEVDGKWIASIKGIGSVSIKYKTTDTLGYESEDIKDYTVTPASLQIIADDKSRLVGLENPELTYTIKGLVYDETIEILTDITISTDATIYSPLGVYDIIVEGGKNVNYTTSLTNGKLSIQSPRLLGLLINDVEHSISLPYDMGDSETMEQKVQVLVSPNTIVTVPEYTLSADNVFRVPTEKPIVREIDIILTSKDGNEEAEEYKLIIERRFIFDKVGTLRWNNTLSVVNNPANLFGYSIVGYQWYKEDKVLTGETKQYYSAGPADNNLLNETKYHVQFKMQTGETLRTSEKEVKLVNTQNATITPNPVMVGETVTLNIDLDPDQLEGGTIEVYNLNGIFQKKISITGRSTNFVLSNNPGLHLVKIVAKAYTKTIKVLVK